MVSKMDWVKSNRLLFIILVVCMGFFAYYIFNALRWISYPHSIDYGEGYVMNYAKLWANGMWKWDINVSPYLTMVYGVGFSILVEPFVKLFGAQLWIGRAFSFATALVSCFLLYLIVVRMIGKKVYGAIAGLLPMTQPVFQDWSIMARVDMVAVMFDLLGLYVAIRFVKSKYIYFAIIPFLFAVMVKVTAVAGLMAVIIYLFIYNRKRTLAFVSMFGVGMIALLTPLMILSNGDYWKHLILYQNTIQNISIPQFLALFSGFIYPFVALLILAFLYVSRNYNKKQYTIVSIFLVVALAIDALTTLRPGAACLYYFEAVMAGSVCACLGLSYMMAYVKRKKLKLSVVTLACGVVALASVILPLRFASFPDGAYTKSIDTIMELVSDSQKPIITENPAIALNIGKDIYIEYFVFTNMTRLGYWNEVEYVSDYNEQYFDYVVLLTPLKYRIVESSKGIPDGHFTDNALLAMGKNYSLIYIQTDYNWQYSIFLYEANGKLAIDKRQSHKEIYPVWDGKGWKWNEY